MQNALQRHNHLRHRSSTCSSPDTSTSLDTASPPTTNDLNHMYTSLFKASSNVLMAENVHLKEMLVSQLDLIQLQSKTILSKDKQLKQLREEKIIYLRETFKKDNYFNLGGGKLSSTFVKIKLV